MKERLYYFDTSALIKRYIEESGSERVDKLWPANPNHALTASLTFAEMYAAFYRLNRDGRISGKQRNLLCAQFESDWKTMAIVEFVPEIRRKVPEVIAKAALRGADLVHMATVAYLLERSVGCQVITFDGRMIQACDDLGIGVALTSPGR